MSASATDYFTHVGNPGTATSLSAPGHTIAGTSINVVSTSNWPTDTGVIFAMDQVALVGGEETRVAGTYTEWEGVVTGGTTIGSMALRYGTDQNYSAGSTTRVYIPVASSRENRMVDGISVSHKQDGTLKPGVVDTTELADDAVTAAKIESGAVGPTEVAAGAITLGYAQITTNFVLSASQTTPTQVTGLSVTVTIPAGGRKIRITAYCGVVTLAAGIGTVTIWDGTVNSGTQLQQANIPTSGIPANPSIIVTPSAGSKTYNVGVSNTGLNNTTVGGAATQPAYILVEAI